ncbi:MAG: hypothetical protein AAF677_05805 [Pseudomonadota bacterium]
MSFFSLPSPRSRSRAITRLLGAATLAIPLTACSLSVPIQEHAISYNKAVGVAEDRMFLLNVVRASQRYPMHFTRILKVTGALETSASVSLQPPFGIDAAEVFGATFGANIKSTPTFEIDILDDQEFTRGILTPINSELFQILLEQG